MKRTIRMLSLGILAALLASSCGRDDAGSRSADHPEAESEEHEEHSGEEGVVELTPEAVDRIGLTTTAAALRSLAGQRETTGKLGFDEERLAHVAPRVSGRIVRVPAALGAVVSAGELLAVVDSMELGEAKATYLRARARHEVARRRFEREQALRADRISSEQEVLEAEAETREAAADLAASREILRLLGLGAEVIEKLRWEDDESSLVPVRAPFAGKIVAREATLGELVTPKDTLFTVADLSKVWLWIDLYERDLAHVRPGERVEVRLDAWPLETATAELAYIADQLDPASRTVRARVDLTNPSGRLKPGLFARVTLATGGEEPAGVLAVPLGAVQRDGEESIVFVEIAPGRFERREVELGRVTDELVEVLAGVSPGDEIVTEGAFLLKSQVSAEELGGHHH